MLSRISSVLGVVMFVCPACAPEDEGAEFRSSTSGTGGGAGNGTVFNTNVIDDAAVSELLQPMGQAHKDVSLDEVTLDDGEPVVEFGVIDGELYATSEQGDKRSGAALLRSRWSLSGDTRWQSALVLAERVVIDGWPHYRFTRGSLWGSTCEGAGETVYARLLTGFTLDERSGEVTPLAGNTYVACTNGATGKAATWGYYDLAVALGDFAPFEAAIRMIRADYCYDGASHTQPGVGLQVHDMWGNGDADAVGAVEAVWGADGLLCRGTGRSAEIPTTCGGRPVPACGSNTSLESWPGGLFLTRLAPKKVVEGF